MPCAPCGGTRTPPPPPTPRAFSGSAAPGAASSAPTPTPPPPPSPPPPAPAAPPPPARPPAAALPAAAARPAPPPPRRVGIACASSGSMAAFAGPVASAAWILARAASLIPGAQTATVTYGDAVRPVTRPGHAPAHVTEFTAPDSTEKFCKAIDALDGALGLSGPRAARLLVIISDGPYPADDRTSLPRP